MCVCVCACVRVCDTCLRRTATQMDSMTYFKMKFKSIVTHKQMTEYTILDIELLGPRQGKVCLHWQGATCALGHRAATTQLCHFTNG